MRLNTHMQIGTRVWKSPVIADRLTWEQALMPIAHGCQQGQDRPDQDILKMDVISLWTARSVMPACPGTQTCLYLLFNQVYSR